MLSIAVAAKLFSLPANLKYVSSVILSSSLAVEDTKMVSSHDGQAIKKSHRRAKDRARIGLDHQRVNRDDPMNPVLIAYECLVSISTY